VFSKRTLLPTVLRNRTTHLAFMSSNGHSKPQTATDVGDLSAAVKMGNDASKVVDSVQDYYGEVLKSTEDLKTSACCTAVSPPPEIRALLSKVPNEVVAKYYGCGSPFPQDIQGLRVLDLGSGSGRDCYVCAALVGPNGTVTGLDMTPSLLEVARRYVDKFCTETLGYSAPNLRFLEGRIEDLKSAGLEDDSIDLIISNCVVNLSPDKLKVLEEAYRVLAPGGEMYFSDVYCDRRLPANVRTHPVLLGECLGGALYEEDFLRLARKAGFEDPRRLATTVIDVHVPDLQELLGDATFYSITFRLFKIPGRLESLCEDYGQACKYKGTIAGSKFSYKLDDHHVFETGKWYETCGNTAAMVGESWLSQHFEVNGDRSTHYGVFAGKEESKVKTGRLVSAPGGTCCQKRGK
jgi:arsenite methyltransferase